MSDDDSERSLLTDEEADGYLSAMAMKDWPRVLVVGSFDRPVTIYSQQVRALNIPYLLFRRGIVRLDDPVVVVGGGVAGLTAAAGLARLGAKVTLLEQREILCPLFEGCTVRWIHPYIYYWPLPGAQANRVEAALPLMSWRAGYVHDVNICLLEEWEKHKAAYGIQLVEGANVQFALPSRKPGEPRPGTMEISWKREGKTREYGTFSAVIFALGYGIETSELKKKCPCRSYWRNDDIAQAQLGGPKRYLVTGTGDGGVIDLLRIRWKRFRHHEILPTIEKLMLPAELNALTEELLRIENMAHRMRTQDRRNDGEISRYLHQEYGRLPVPAAVIQYVSKNLRTDTTAVLNGPFERAYQLGASVLNRFFLSLLDRVGDLDYRPDRISASHITKVDGDYQVYFQGQGYTEKFNEIVVRHGAESALQRSFKSVYDDTAPPGGFRASRAEPRQHWPDDAFDNIAKTTAVTQTSELTDFNDSHVATLVLAVDYLAICPEEEFPKAFNAFRKRYRESPLDCTEPPAGTSPGLLLAGTLLQREPPPPKGKAPWSTVHLYRFSGTWKPPQSTATALWDRVRVNDGAKIILTRYVSKVLPDETAYFPPPAFAEFITRLGWELSEAFHDALDYLLDRPQEDLQTELVLYCLLSGSAPDYVGVLNMLLKEYDRSERWWRDTGAPHSRKIEQAEVPLVQEEYLEHLVEINYRPIRTALTWYLKLRRQQCGYAWIAIHARAADLWSFWRDALQSYRSGATDASEWQELLRACPPDMMQDAWESLEDAPASVALNLLMSALVQAQPGDRKLADVLGAIRSSRRLQDLLVAENAALLNLAPTRRAQVVFSMRLPPLFSDDSSVYPDDLTVDADEARAGAHLWSQFSVVEKETLLLCRQVADGFLGETPALPGQMELASIDAERRNLLGVYADGGDGPLSSAAIAVLQATGHGDAGRLRGLLDSTDWRARQLALRLVAADADKQARVIAALSDIDYRCRLEAINQLAKLCAAGSAEQELLLGRSDDPSGPVRGRVVTLISEHGWTEGIPHLVKRLSDPWDDSRGPDEERSIARDAAHALRRLSPIPRKTLDQIVAFLALSKEATPDFEVHAALVSLLSEQPSAQAVPLLESVLRRLGRVGTMRRRIVVIAAYALASHIRLHEESRSIAHLPLLLELSGNKDGQLAGPSLLTLGMLTPKNSLQVPPILAAKKLGEKRNLVYLAGALLAGHASLNQLTVLSLANHPAAPLIRAVIANAAPSPEAREQFKSWLQTLAATEDGDVTLLLYSELREALRDATAADAAWKGIGKPSPHIADESGVSGPTNSEVDLLVASSASLMSSAGVAK